MGLKVTKEAVCRWVGAAFLGGDTTFLLSHVTAEVLGRSPLVPPPNCLLLACHEEKKCWPALVVLAPYMIQPKSVLPVLLRRPEVALTAARAGVRFLMSLEGTLQGSETKVLVFKSRFSAYGFLRSKASVLCKTNTGVWVTRKRLFKESKHNLLYWKQRPYVLWVFASIVLCICFPKYGTSLPLVHRDLIGFKCRAIVCGLNMPWFIINENQINFKWAFYCSAKYYTGMVCHGTLAAGSSQEFSALWVIHKACVKLCFSLLNVFLPYMNNQWGFFFFSVLVRKDFFLMRSFNSSVAKPVEDCSLSQQVLQCFDSFLSVWSNTTSISLETVLHSHRILPLGLFS